MLWLVYLGYGVLGGTGLGIGYISPVSTLIKWFPDRPGMATGLAIMGFGGGAMIGSPLGVTLMAYFKTGGITWRCRHLHNDGTDLSVLHAGWRFHDPHSGARLEACGLRAGYQA